nr:hypothetical protein [Tanacetum cinerariifolium]
MSKDLKHNVDKLLKCKSFGLSHDESFGVDDLDLNVIVNEVVANSAEEDVVHGSGKEDAEEGNGHKAFKETSGEQVDSDVNEIDNKENKIVEPDVDLHMFVISKDVPFDNIGVINLVIEDVLQEEDVLRG